MTSFPRVMAAGLLLAWLHGARACTYFEEKTALTCADSLTPGAMNVESVADCRKAADAVNLVGRTTGLPAAEALNNWPGGCYVFTQDNNKLLFNSPPGGTTTASCAQSDLYCICQTVSCANPTSTPLTGAPATLPPATGAPKTGIPSTGAPETHAPPPATEAPATAAPRTATPTGAPATAAPATAAPATDTPASTPASPGVPETPAPTGTPPPPPPPPPPTGVVPATGAPPATSEPGSAPGSPPSSSPQLTPPPPSAAPHATQPHPPAQSEVPATQAPMTHVPNQMAEETETMGSSAGIAAGVSGFVAGSAASTATMLAILADGTCTNKEKPMVLPLHPTQLTLWDSIAAGAVVGNLMIMLFVGAVGYLCLIILAQTRCFAEQQTTVLDLQGMLRYPSAPLFVLLFLYQGTFAGAVRLVIWPPGDHMGLVVLGFLALIPLVGAPLWLVNRIRGAVHPVAQSGKAYYRLDSNKRGRVFDFIVGAGEWVSTSRRNNWVPRYQTMVRSYKQKHAWFVFFEFLGMALLAIATNSNTTSWTQCGHVRMFMALLNFAMMLVEAFLAPHVRHRDNCIDILRLFIQGVAMLCMSFGFYSNDAEHGGFGAAGPLLLVATALLLLKLVLDIVAEIWILCTGRRNELQEEAWKETEAAELESLNQTLPLCVLDAAMDNDSLGKAVYENMDVASPAVSPAACTDRDDREEREEQSWIAFGGDRDREDREEMLDSPRRSVTPEEVVPGAAVVPARRRQSRARPSSPSSNAPSTTSQKDEFAATKKKLQTELQSGNYQRALAAFRDLAKLNGGDEVAVQMLCSRLPGEKRERIASQPLRYLATAVRQKSRVGSPVVIGGPRTVPRSQSQNALPIPVISDDEGDASASLPSMSPYLKPSSPFGNPMSPSLKPSSPMGKPTAPKATRRVSHAVGRGTGGVLVSDKSMMY